MKPLRWAAPPPSPKLEAGTLHLWELPFSTLPLPRDLPQILSSEEIARANRLRIPEKKTQFIQGRTVLRIILAKYLDMAPEEIQFGTGPQGKPFVSQLPGFGFNLSHSGDLALLAIGPSSVGVDIERRQVRDFLALSQRFFSSKEGALIAESPTPEYDFYRIWTAKEAILKAHGAGLTIPLNRFSVTQAEKDRVNLEDNRWDLWQFVPRDGYCGAVSWDAISRIQRTFCFSFSSELL